MTIQCEPFESKALASLPDTEAMNDAMRALATGCNGSVYLGDRIEALVEAVRLLRSRPDLAQALGVAPTPDAELVERVRELMAWQATGVLKGETLRTYAQKQQGIIDADLRVAEEFTKREVFQFVVNQAGDRAELALKGNQKKRAPAKRR
jgi:hypothetical protein